MSTAIYAIPGYPTVYHTPAGTPLTIRPMLSTDKEALLDFFRRISPEDRLYLPGEAARAVTPAAFPRDHELAHCHTLRSHGPRVHVTNSDRDPQLFSALHLPLHLHTA
jgi:hypothetical protein